MPEKLKAKKAKLLFLLVLAAPCASAQVNPVPFIDLPLVPTGTTPMGSAFTMTVNGAGFVPGSVVVWNGATRATTFVSSARVTATIPASDIAIAESAAITVVNPVPGGGKSNAVAFEINNSTASVTFTRRDFGTGSEPDTVGVADLNGDGKADLVTINEGDGTVAILLGNGDGTFRSAVRYTVGDIGNLEGVAFGDFNGDGKLDLAVCGGNGGTIYILLGNGDGTFVAPVGFATGGPAADVAVGDFNGDGKLDLAISNATGFTVAILLGKGDGTFQSPITQPVGGRAESVAVGDFNGDGKLDVATANAYNAPEGVAILLGNGDGTLQPYVYYQAGTTPQSLTVADFNGDGVLDIAVGNFGDNTISVFLGKGDGTFQAQKVYSAGVEVISIAPGDFDGDGKVDLVITGTGSAAILIGNGDGTFQSPLALSVGASPSSVVVADFNLDGKLDLATADEAAAAVSVLVQNVAPSVLLSPAKLSFDKELLGTTSAPKTVTVKNTGTAVLKKLVIRPPSADFPEEPNCGSTVAVNESCSVSVTFAPIASDTRTGAVVVTDNASNSPQRVTLSGIGVAIDVSPARLAFGSHKVGTSSAIKTVSVKNVGTATVTFTRAIMVNGSDSADFTAMSNDCGTGLAAGASCTVGIEFTPTAPGTRNATLEVSDDGGGSPQKVPLSGTGT